MGWPRYGEDLDPEFWGLDKKSQKRKEAEIQLAIQRKGIIIGTLIGLAIATIAIGLPTVIFLGIIFYK